VPATTVPHGREVGIEIRQATPDDAVALARLHVDAWRSAYRGLVPDAFLEGLDYGRRAQRFRDALVANTEETYLAEQSGEVLGILTVGACRDADVDHETTGEIWGIYLAPQHWRKGIGRTLCQYGERLLSLRGYLAATLWVLAGNDRARRFYEAMGFSADGASRMHDFGAVLEAVRYRRALDSVEPLAADVPGLSFRPIRGEQDAEDLYAVHAGRMAHDQIDPLSLYEDMPSLDGLRMSLAQAVAEGREDEWVVAQVHAQVVGYSQVKCWPEDDGTWVYLTLGWVLPEWRGRGIGTAMLYWAEDRSRRLAAAWHPGEPFELAANASSTEKEATALLTHEGYRAGYTVLELSLDPTRPVPAYSLPVGIEVRPVRPEHLPLIAASIGEAYWQEYEEGRFQESYDPAAYAAELSAPNHDPTLWQVAWEGDQVAGQVLTIVEKGRAELFEVSVRPAWRRCGLARALLSRALRCLRGRGIDVIRIGTVSEFHTRARDLYTSVGFRVVKEFPRYRKPVA
jgi:ribosomal protein S18 acetylase RimI-like enzyme